MTVTIKDIAREVGVSITTVSRALTGYSDVAEETRRRILETAVALGYSPNVTAQRLQKRRTDTIGFITPTHKPRFSDPFFSEFMAGIGNEAASQNYDLLVSTHAPDSEEEQKVYRRTVKGGWVDGLIVVRTRKNDTRIQLLSERNFPFVAFGRTQDDLDFPYVDEDSEAGMRLSVQHFIDLGHRRIGLISPPPGLNFGVHRLQSYFDTMGDNGLSVQSEWIVTGDMSQVSGFNVVESLLALDSRPTAIIGGNDLMAIGAIKRIQQSGLQVGKDIAVCGFDDIPLAAFVNPPLTTIHQPIYDIGKQTTALLIDIINNRRLANVNILLAPTLVVRESSGKPIG